MRAARASARRRSRTSWPTRWASSSSRTSGPVIEHKGALAALLTTKLQKNDILFVDEIHRLNPVVEESLYPALDDSVIDIMTGEGAFASAVQIPLQPFTLVGATTRTGLLTAPLLSRFGHVVRLDFYPPEDLARIVLRSARLLGVAVDDDAAPRDRAARRAARRASPTACSAACATSPRCSARASVDLARVREACERLEVDEAGLDEMDRRYLTVVIDHYDGGPVGVDALAAALAEPRDTLEDVVEPFLIQQGYRRAHAPRARRQPQGVRGPREAAAGRSGGPLATGRRSVRVAVDGEAGERTRQTPNETRCRGHVAFGKRAIRWPRLQPAGTLLYVPGGPVLVVDDDTVSRHVLIQALANADLPHVAVGSGAEALEQIERVQPSLVLLDLVMPPPDGYQILRILRARAETRDLPVVVLTALEADEEIARAFEAGADDFVRKPFKPVELVARIRGQLRIRGFVEALAKKEQDARLVLELTQALASNLDFRGILFTVVQRIAEVAKVDRVSIVLVREAGDVGYVVAASDDEKLRDLPIDLAKYPEIQQVLSSREPLVIPDVATHPLLEIVRHEGHKSAFSSLAILPILYEGRPMGVLFLRARHAFTFGDRELALCRTVSNAMAIALRNARVMQSLRDQTQQVTVARFEAERRLRTLQRYADFFESAADGIIVIDAEGHLLFSNPRARAITGYTEADLAGRRVGDLFAERGRDASRTSCASASRAGATRRTSTSESQRKNGESRSSA